MNVRNKKVSRILVVVFVAITGVVCGLGSYTFIYANGVSYLSNDPKSCINCHVMREQFVDWNHSSHKSFATCNDCHAPRDFIGKWSSKAINGWNHSLAFTTGNFPDPIRINDFNRKIVQDNCVGCHKTFLKNTIHRKTQKELRCIECHRDIGH